jgi:hypothetical protein
MSSRARILTFVCSNWKLLMGVSAAGVALALVVWTVENMAPTALIVNAEAAGQFIGGNWPPQANDHSTIWFAAGPAFRLILVLGAISGAWRAFTRIADILEMQKMKLMDFLEDRDRAIETRVLQALGHLQDQYREQIHRAIQLGHEDFVNEYLPILIQDESAAARIREHIKSAEI